MNRRDFLRKVAVGAGAVAVAPVALALAPDRPTRPTGEKDKFNFPPGFWKKRLPDSVPGNVPEIEEPERPPRSLTAQDVDDLATETIKHLSKRQCEDEYFRCKVVPSGFTGSLPGYLQPQYTKGQTRLGDPLRPQGQYSHQRAIPFGSRNNLYYDKNGLLRGRVT